MARKTNTSCLTKGNSMCADKEKSGKGKRGRKPYEKAVFFPFECLIEGIHDLDIFEGRIRYLRKVEGYKEIVMYPINSCSTNKAEMRYFIDHYIVDPEIQNMLRLVSAKPLCERENVTIYGYGDFKVVNAIGINIRAVTINPRW